jgi:hypothetical protein
MGDYLFDEVLNRRGNVTRPVVEVGGEGLAREARYELAKAAVPLRVRPARATLDYGLLGKWPQATAVAYLRPGQAQALDRIGVVTGATALAESAEEGATEITVESAMGIGAGARLHLREGAAFAEAVVEAVEGESVTLREALETGFGAGASVETVVSYEVLGVEDEGGEGHHVRAAVRSR